MSSTKVSVRMPMEQFRFLSELAAQNGRPMSAEIRSHLPQKPTIQNWLKEKGDLFDDNAVPEDWDDMIKRKDDD